MAQSPDNGVINLEIPASPRFCTLARVTAASLAADHDFDVDDIGDLRMAVNEAVGSLVENADGRGRIVMTFVADHDAVTMTCRLTPDVVPRNGAGPDPLAERILEAITDEFELSAGAGRVVKRRTA